MNDPITPTGTLWKDKQPDVGQNFILYLIFDESPYLMVMTVDGPKHITEGIEIEYYGSYGCGGGYLDCHVERHPDNYTVWHAIPGPPNV